MAKTTLVKPIKPKIYDIPRFENGLQKVFEKEGELEAKRFSKTVTSWTGDKPDFGYTIKKKRRNVIMWVGPKGSKMGVKKWTWASEGTKPRTIRARRGPYLKFQSKFRPKTTPRFGSGKGYCGGRWVSVPFVNHPGITPRKWPETMLHAREGIFFQRINKTVETKLKLRRAPK